MTTPKLLAVRGEFPKKQFKSCANELWLQFLVEFTGASNVAYWTIEADSGTVKLSARNSKVDEDTPDWNPPAPIVVLVEGILEAFGSEPKSKHEELRLEFRGWVEKGILDALQSSKVSKKLLDSINSTDFSVVSTAIDEGLAESELSLIWSNGNRLTIAKIKADQAATKRKKR